MPLLTHRDIGCHCQGTEHSTHHQLFIPSDASVTEVRAAEMLDARICRILSPRELSLEYKFFGDSLSLLPNRVIQSLGPDEFVLRSVFSDSESEDPIPTSWGWPEIEEQFRELAFRSVEAVLFLWLQSDASRCDVCFVRTKSPSMQGPAGICVGGCRCCSHDGAHDCGRDFKTSPSRYLFSADWKPHSAVTHPRDSHVVSRSITGVRLLSHFPSLLQADPQLISVLLWSFHGPTGTNPACQVIKEGVILGVFDDWTQREGDQGDFPTPR